MKSSEVLSMYSYLSMNKIKLKDTTSDHRDSYERIQYLFCVFFSPQVIREGESREHAFEGDTLRLI